MLAKPEDVRVLTELDPQQLTDVQLIAYHKWDITRRFIERVDEDRHAIVTHGQGMKPWEPLDERDALPSGELRIRVDCRR